MNKIKILVTLLIITSCAKKTGKKNSDLIELNSSIGQTDTVNTLKQKRQKSSDKKDLELFNYFGFINNFYFSKEPEVYLELYFTGTVEDYLEFDKISQLATEVIYQDDENKRYKLPKKIANEYFDLRGLEQIHFFDSNNKLIGQSLSLKNFEFLEQNISPVFIASYETQIAHENIAYCIGGKKPSFSDIKIKETTDSEITLKIEEYFKVKEYNTSFTLDHKQFNINSHTLTFSNTNDYSFIHLTKENGESLKVYTNADFSNILNVQIIPLIKNKMPILLCNFIRPESDVLWDELLIFKDGKYRNSDRQRIKI